MPSRTSSPMGRASIGTALILIAVGAILAIAVQAPAEVEEYVDVLDLGLILVWSGALILVMQVVMNRRPKPRRSPRARVSHVAPPASRTDETYDHAGTDSWDDRTDEWYENDVHRPGYEGETRRYPTIRDR